MMHIKKGKGRGGEGEFVPRAAFYDFSGTVRPPKVVPGDEKSLRQKDKSGNTTWNNGFAPSDLRSRTKGPDEKIAEFRSDKVRYWNDFSNFLLPSRQIRLMEGLHWKINDYNYFSMGYDLMGNSAQREDMSDTIRRLLERCDHPQGLNMIVDFDSGFGGLAEKCLAEYRDNEPKASVLVWGLSGSPNPYPESAQRRNILNYSVGCARFASLATAVIPMMDNSWASGGVGYDPNNLYHQSLPLSLAISTSLLPLRTPSRQNSNRLFSIYPPVHSLPLPHLLHSLNPIPRANILDISLGLGAGLKDSLSPPEQASPQAERNAERKKARVGLWERGGMQGMGWGGGASRRGGQGKKKQMVVFCESSVLRGVGSLEEGVTDEKGKLGKSRYGLGFNSTSHPQNPSARDPRLRTKKATHIHKNGWQNIYFDACQMQSQNHTVLSTPTPLLLHAKFPKFILNRETEGVSRNPGSPKRSPGIVDRNPSFGSATCIWSHSGMKAKLDQAAASVKALSRRSGIACHFAKHDIAQEEWNETLEGLLRVGSAYEAKQQIGT
ncbi:hypothetical protein AAMO2058_001087800 [Amorphochlora amoebiformis]